MPSARWPGPWRHGYICRRRGPRTPRGARRRTCRGGAGGGGGPVFPARRCGGGEGGAPRHVGWLIGQRPGRGQTGDWQYFWSDFPANTPLAVLVEYAHRRHWVEQYHEEAKTELGWDQYQGRRWDGFHRHAITVMLSYSFLVWLEGCEREHRKGRGRPRAAFSPSPGPSPQAPPGGPSPGERMATLCRPPRIDRTGSH